MGRSPCCAKVGLKRGAWTAQEDKILREYITIHGEGGWRNLPRRAGLKRCGKSCRLRWLNYLRPDIKRGNISPDEEELIIRLHKLLGNRWSLIAGRLPGRTDNEIKNYWNTSLGKKVQNHQNATQPRTVSSLSKEKKKHKINLSHNTSSSAASPPTKMDFKVVRTKAIRCSKVYVETQKNKNEHFDAKDAGTSVDGDHHPINKPFESCRESDPSLDFMMDFNIGENCLSDLLDSFFSDSYDFDHSNNNNQHSLTSILDSGGELRVE